MATAWISPDWAGTDDYHLQPDSVGVDDGVDPADYGWSIPWTGDLDGVDRPLGEGWDIGAYEQ